MPPVAAGNRSTAALEYARRGLSIIPISPASHGGKRPLVAWESYQTRRATEHEIRQWWAQWPEANLGIVTGSLSGVIVLDADGPEGQASLLSLLGSLPHTPTATTGKGLHVFFKHPGASIGNRARLLPGLDVRGDGGFVVAAPSEHENGTVYEWQIGLDVPLMPLPEAVRSLLTPTTAGSGPVKAGEPISNGNRNAALYTLGRVLHARGLSPAAIHAALEKENETRCIPPLDARELQVIITQATTQPDRPDFTPPAPEPPVDPLAVIDALPNVAPLPQVAEALKAAFASIRAHVPGRLEREVLTQTIITRLDQKRIDRATRLVQAAAAESQAIEASTKPADVSLGGGALLAFTDPDPWPESVDGAAWLEEVMALLREYLILPDQAAEAIALWLLQTYTLDAADVTPRLTVLSPVKRCGKSRLLTLLLFLSRRALPASNVTAATVYRVIEKWSPTLIIDEADAFINGNEELRGVVNSGHTRSLAHVIRTVGDDHDPRAFSTWGAMAIAKIGELDGKWETVADRSIIVRMRRRAPYEQVNRSFPKKTDRITRLQRQAMRWAIDHLPTLKTLTLPEPEQLDDRAADNWSPLLNLAHVIGQGWPEKAVTAALTLSGAEERESKSASILILEDTRAFFQAYPELDQVTTEDLLAWLTEEEGLAEHGWNTYRRGFPINAKGVGRLLEPFRIKPGQWREGGRGTPKVRGYRKSQFLDAWDRYLGPLTPSDDPDGGGGPGSNAIYPHSTPQLSEAHEARGKFVNEIAENRASDRCEAHPRASDSVSGRSEAPTLQTLFSDEPVDTLAVRRTLANLGGPHAH